MDSPRLKREFWLYGLAFGLALVLRLLRLGAFPLTDMEAVPAMQALQVALGLRPVIGPNSAYVLLTGIFFFAFESSNFIARFIPALAGSFLVFAPLLFRHRIKPRTALVLAFFLGIDPGLLALSRQAGSGILSVTFLLFAWGLWERKSARLAGVLAAFALLSGPSLWAGLLGLALTWAILQGLEYRSQKDDKTLNTDSVPFGERRSLNTVSLKSALPSFFITLVLFGTFFFLIPGGLNGMIASLTAYIQGWRLPSAASGRFIFSSLFFYQPLSLLLALVMIVRGWWVGSRRVIRLSVWLLVSLLLAVFYPARQVQDLAWALIPLSALAALELARHFDLRPNERAEVFGVTLLTVIILIFVWFDLSGLVWSPTPEGGTNLRVWLFFGSIFLVVISLLLVAVGWSIRTARLGAVWGATIMLGIFMLGAGLSAGRIRMNYSSEFWATGPYPAHAELLAATVDQLSEWKTGNVDALPVTVAGLDSPALLWALRGHEVSVVDKLDASTAPAIVITPLQDSVNLAASYRGQDFTWNQQTAWDSVNPNDWLRWIVLREMPQSYDTILLWARNDLFLDSAPQTAP